MAARSPSRMSSLQRGRHSPYDPRDDAPPQSVHQAAALRGASHAFAKAPVKPRTSVNIYSSINGAMAAATAVGTRGNSPARNEPSAQFVENRGGAGPGDAPLSAAQQSFARGQVVRGSAKSSSPNSLLVPGNESSVSSSNIAATLAAARFTPQNTGNISIRPSQSPTGTSSSPRDTGEHHDVLPVAGSVSIAKQHFMRLDQGSGAHSTLAQGGTPTANKDHPTDTTSIAPTISLIGLFEHNQSNVDPWKANGISPKSTGAAPIIQSPRPIRPPPRSTPLAAAILATQKSMPSKMDGKAPRPLVADKSRRPAIVHNSNIQQGTPPLSPPCRTQPTNSKATTSSDKALSLGSPESIQKLPVNITLPRLGPKEIPLEAKKNRKVGTPTSLRRAPSTPETDSDDSSSAASYVSAPDIRRKPTVPPPRRQRSQQANAQGTSPLLPQNLDRVSLVPPKEKEKPFEEDSQIQSTPQFHPGTSSWQDGLPISRSGGKRTRPPAQRIISYPTGESFADALTASSLASSRAPSPSKSPAPPPLPRRHHRLLHQHHHQNSRTPSPARGMRHTMRKLPKSDDENQGATTHRRGRKNLIKKAPNKHHEGDRRRWRDEITGRERKRYEGVWAANKGLHIFVTEQDSQPPESLVKADWKEDVSNLVVRDIWSRSRLDQTILEEVWELVDRRGIGRLTREEFVVGMWLIDQRLKGRKLPVKISSSVWGSVRKLGDMGVYGHKA